MYLLSTIADICGLVGFVLTLLTLYNTFYVKKSLLTINDINDFKPIQADFSQEIKGHIQNIKDNSDLSKLSDIFHSVQETLQRIDSYSIWNNKKKDTLKKAYRFFCGKEHDIAHISSDEYSIFSSHPIDVEKLKSESITTLESVNKIVTGEIKYFYSFFRRNMD